VAPEVSSLDFANGISLSGFTVPALNIRRVKTEVELSEGQSFAIGGLLDNRDNETFEKIPFIGDVPVLGKLFQSINKTKSNTELIVIVTPEIVPPIPAGQPGPEIKYPKKFLSSASGVPMQNPQNTAATEPPAPASMPVEKLIESMKPETPLVDTGTFSTSGGGSSGNSGTTATP
jgi:pilus assembly protein CpaC